MHYHLKIKSNYVFLSILQVSIFSKTDMDDPQSQIETAIKNPSISQALFVTTENMSTFCCCMAGFPIFLEVHNKEFPHRCKHMTSD